jgi:hypothetical protein
MLKFYCRHSRNCFQPACVGDFLARSEGIAMVVSYGTTMCHYQWQFASTMDVDHHGNPKKKLDQISKLQQCGSILTALQEWSNSKCAPMLPVAHWIITWLEWGQPYNNKTSLTKGEKEQSCKEHKEQDVTRFYPILEGMSTVEDLVQSGSFGVTVQTLRMCAGYWTNVMRSYMLISMCKISF